MTIPKGSTIRKSHRLNNTGVERQSDTETVSLNGMVAKRQSDTKVERLSDTGP